MPGITVVCLWAAVTLFFFGPKLVSIPLAINLLAVIVVQVPGWLRDAPWRRDSRWLGRVNRNAQILLVFATLVWCGILIFPPPAGFEGILYFTGFSAAFCAYVAGVLQRREQLTDSLRENLLMSPFTQTQPEQENEVYLLGEAAPKV